MLDSWRPHLAAALPVAAALALAGCDLGVSNPDIIDAATLDPVEDARTLSMSAQQNFYQAYGTLINATALYSGETWTGAVRQESNDISRRAIVDTNIDLNATLWSPLQSVIATNDEVVQVLSETPGFDADLNAARSSMWAGFGLASGDPDVARDGMETIRDSMRRGMERDIEEMRG
jgi:hypothetical protein